MESVSLPASVSLLHNNLVSSGSMLSFASNTTPIPQIYLIPLETLSLPNTPPQLVNYKNEEEILHINYISLKQNWYLVLGCYQNLQIWKEDGTRMLGYISKDDIPNGGSDTYFVGSCGCDLQQSIVVGSSRGYISMLSLSEDQGLQFSVASTLVGRFREPIAVVCCYRNTALSCNEVGQVTFWDLKHMNEVISLDQTGVSATVGTTFKKYGIIGFGSGEVRVYNLREKVIVASLWAHARWITGIAKHPSRPIFVTCAEDGYIHAWAIRRGEIELVASKELLNMLLTGVTVLGDIVYAVSYDKAKINIINMFYSG